MKVHEGLGLQHPRRPAVPRDERHGRSLVGAEAQRPVEGLPAERDGGQPAQVDGDRIDDEHHVALGQRHVVVEGGGGDVDVAQVMQPAAGVEAVAAQHGPRDELDAEVEEIAGPRVDLRVRAERADPPQRAVERLDALRLERVGVERVRLAALPEGEQLAGVQHDARVRDVCGQAQGVGEHSSPLQRPDAALRHARRRASGEVVVRPHVPVAVPDDAVVEDEHREHAVAVEQMAHRLAADLPPARPVAVQGAAQLRGERALGLVDDVVVLVEERFEDPVGPSGGGRAGGRRRLHGAPPRAAGRNGRFRMVTPSGNACFRSARAYHPGHARHGRDPGLRHHDAGGGRDRQRGEHAPAPRSRAPRGPTSSARAASARRSRSGTPSRRPAARCPRAG